MRDPHDVHRIRRFDGLIVDQLLRSLLRKAGDAASARPPTILQVFKVGLRYDWATSPVVEEKVNSLQQLFKSDRLG
jgi:hypothetical protein